MNDTNVMHTVHHNLERFKKVIIHVPNEERMASFFENQFERQIKTDFKDGLKLVQDMLEHSFGYDDPSRYIIGDPQIAGEAFEQVMAQLRFVKFIRGEE